MQCQILLVIHNKIQGNLEGESGNLSEVTQGFSPGTPAIRRSSVLLFTRNQVDRGSKRSVQLVGVMPPRFQSNQCDWFELLGL